MRTMTEVERKNALRDPAWRKAALETDASLSGVSPTFHRAIYEAELREKFPAELEGVAGGKRAIETVLTAMDAAAKALENELRVTEGAVPGPAPAETPAWVKE